MELSFVFFLNSVLLGIGLAIDAFSVSMANGLNEPYMKSRKALGIAGVFGLFQAAMPMLGWICVHTILRYFVAFEKFIPWIALALLGFIGGKMLFEAKKNMNNDKEAPAVGVGALLLQGVATSIDALSVGFMIADYDLGESIIAASIIAVVTFALCVCGVYIGKKFGMKLKSKASVFGGIILIGIGIEIFISGII